MYNHVNHKDSEPLRKSLNILLSVICSVSEEQLMKIFTLCLCTLVVYSYSLSIADQIC